MAEELMAVETKQKYVEPASRRKDLTYVSICVHWQYIKETDKSTQVVTTFFRGIDESTLTPYLKSGKNLDAVDQATLAYIRNLARPIKSGQGCEQPTIGVTDQGSYFQPLWKVTGSDRTVLFVNLGDHALF